MQNSSMLHRLAHLAPLSVTALLLATGCGATMASPVVDPAPAGPGIALDQVGFDRQTTGATPENTPADTPENSPENTPENTPNGGPSDGGDDPLQKTNEKKAPIAPSTTSTPTTSGPPSPAPPKTTAAATEPADPNPVPSAPADNVERTPPITVPRPTVRQPTPQLPVFPTPTIPVPVPVTIPPIFETPAPAPGPCGTFDAIPAGATITSDLSVALDADGVADDQIITYISDGLDTLRSIRNGVISEFDVPDVGVSHIRALGVGNVGEISAGNEIVMRTGGGASGASVGIFGHDSGGCLFEFTRYGNPLELYIGATIGNSSGAACFDGGFGEWGYTQDTDGTYLGSSAAYFESTAGDFTYLPASDAFSEGLALEDLSPATLDCFGFGL